MKIVVDESVSFGLVEALRSAEHTVIAISETPTTGLQDDRVFKLAEENGAVLITRDYHFTNAVRFPANKTEGLIYIRRGNLSAAEEIKLVQNFLSRYSPKDYTGRLVTLYIESLRIR